MTDEQRIFPLTGAPTPDDLDELLTKVWKEPASSAPPAGDCRLAAKPRAVARHRPR